MHCGEPPEKRSSKSAEKQRNTMSSYHSSASLLHQLRAAAAVSRQKTSLTSTSSIWSLLSSAQSNRLVVSLCSTAKKNPAAASASYHRRPLSAVSTASATSPNYFHRRIFTSTRMITRQVSSGAMPKINCSTLSSPLKIASATGGNRHNVTADKTDTIIEATKTNTTTDYLDRRTIYELLKLSKFTSSELHWRFDQITLAGDRLHEHVHGPFFHNHHQDAEAAKLVVEEERLIASELFPSFNSTGTSFTDTNVKNDNNDNSKEEADKKDSKKEKEDSIRTIMHIQDLEAYMYERYLHIDDQWDNHYRCEKATAASSSSSIANTFTTATTKDADTSMIDEQNGTRLRLQRIRQCAKADATSIFQLLLENVADPPIITNSTTTTSIAAATTTLTKDQFQQSIQTLATKVQYSTILPLATSMLLVGSSVGVISPIMPFLANKLDLTTTLYGIVVSSFALSKMLGNVPSAMLVERHGRKPYLVHSLWAVGLGVAGMGLATDWMQLSACRMIIGLGVASLTTASTLTVADSSTPLSRASTFSPLMGAFAAGMAIGPAIGGLLCDTWGIQNTFFAVATIYGIASIWNHVGVNETKRHGQLWEMKTLPWHNTDTTEALTLFSKRSNDETTELVSISHTLKDTIAQWTSLLADKQLRPIIIMNGFYMSTFAAAQLTLLPLLLTGGGTTPASGATTGLALSATAMGQVYMWMSITQVLSNPVAGLFADRIGKSAAIVTGGMLTSFAVASVPLVYSYGLIGESVFDWSNWPMLATLSFWSLGGTLLATSHVAAVSDEVNDSSRSQAIALLRTSGDIGYLCGAACAGISADLVGDVGTAMQAGGAAFLGATTWFGLKSAALNKLVYKR